MKVHFTILGKGDMYQSDLTIKGRVYAHADISIIPHIKEYYILTPSEKAELLKRFCASPWKDTVTKEEMRNLIDRCIYVNAIEHVYDHKTFERFIVIYLSEC
jgi:hypothetical protein